jgi:ABC-type microcin C transport system permease subunit YejB
LLCSLAVLRLVVLCFALGCGASCFVVVASLLVCIGFALAGFLLRFALLLLVCGVCFLLLLALCFVVASLRVASCFA